MGSDRWGDKFRRLNYSCLCSQHVLCECSVWMRWVIKCSCVCVWRWALKRERERESVFIAKDKESDGYRGRASERASVCEIHTWKDGRYEKRLRRGKKKSGLKVFRDCISLKKFVKWNEVKCKVGSFRWNEMKWKVTSLFTSGCEMKINEIILHGGSWNEV